MNLGNRSYARPHYARPATFEPPANCQLLANALKMSPQSPRNSVSLSSFRPHPLLRGGHLQTIATTWVRPPHFALPTEQFIVPLPDGDALVLHDTPASPHFHVNQQAVTGPERPNLLLVHGLCGSHQASYMLRLTLAFTARGVRCFRLDMRGCGAGSELASQVNHAGRSADIMMALEKVAHLAPQGPIWIVGVSLGGNQLLKLLGEIGRGDLQPSPQLRDRIQGAVAVAPPIDLLRCSKNMERYLMRPYNRFFVRNLFRSIPNKVRTSPEFARLDLRKPPKTLWELDQRVTAPLSGFASARDYYQQASACTVLAHNPIPTLVLAAQNDPIVPVDCFRNLPLPDNYTLETPRCGGHVAFFSRGPARFWMDHRITRWFFPAEFSG